MSLQSSITQVILEVGITTISELLRNLVYFILIIYGIKRVPTWLDQYDKMKMKHYRIEQALAGRRL